ncbi:MAG: hypothetical protein JOZ23_04185 [Mycobacterium sp.]|nr:hypothetical protein [Mycobacterium sp.]
MTSADGGGKRLFPDDNRARALELISTTATWTGVLICTYRPAAEAIRSHEAPSARKRPPGQPDIHYALVQAASSTVARQHNRG